ncbi:MAG TPA: thiamine phosphate synthase [Bryobacteraceae bacterium]|nr:thiamine phosphate synthase [Bryobacteraceae bacterium]
MTTCYITDRFGFGGDVHALLGCIERNAQAGVSMIQIREKDLAARELLSLTRRAVAVSGSASVLVNGRIDVAIAAGAHGVHLPSGSIQPRRWRSIVPDNFVIGLSCHSLEDVRAAEGADYILFSPVFESPGKGKAVGLAALRQVCQASPVPVLALGGITHENAPSCMEAGAAGFAAIRMFQAAG